MLSANIIIHMTSISKQAIEIALHELDMGYGEQDRDNSGPDIAKYFCEPWIPLKIYGHWCAAFWSWCLEMAGMDGLTRKERQGARALVRAVARRGCWVYQPQIMDMPKKINNPKVGDTICWYHKNSWKKYVGGIESYDPSIDLMIVIQGNVGPFPSKVRRKIYPDGKWRLNLYGISRLDV